MSEAVDCAVMLVGLCVGRGALVRILVCAMICGLALAQPARASDPALRTTIVPTTGAAVAVHRRILLAAEVQARLAMDDEGGRQEDPVGVAVRAGPSFVLNPVLTLDLQYAYAWGMFPIDGLGVEEHRVVLGLRVGTPRADGQRLALSNRTRLDLRNYRLATPGAGFSFHLRPRNESVATLIVRPWFQTSLQVEALLQPDLGGQEMLQTRFGLIFHGRIDLGRERSSERNPALFWVAGSQLGLSPIVLAKHRTEAIMGGQGAGAGGELGAGHDLDLVFTVGLSGAF